MTDERFILCQDDLGNYEIMDGDKVYHFLWEVAPILNEQQSIIRRDEMSIKTMMSNMKKLEEANDNMNLFIKQTIQPLLSDCAFELVTIESMSQIELAGKIENEIIPFIQDFKYLKYESLEKENKRLRECLDEADDIITSHLSDISITYWRNYCKTLGVDL